MKALATSKVFPLSALCPLWVEYFVIFVACHIVFFAAPVSGQQQYKQSDIAAGAKLYAGQCATCHGPNGDQIGGVDLGSNKFRRAISDQDLINVIRAGIVDAGMPSHDFPPAQMTSLVAYLRNMRNASGIAAKLGDPERGRNVFEGKGGCLTCHSVNGRGAHAAPDLSSIGTARPADLLQKTLLEPNAVLVPINKPVRLVKKDGSVITGRRLNEDTFTVQIADDSGRLLSFVKANLREYTVLNTGRMPSFRDTLSSAEIADLLAYLLTLNGTGI